MNEDMLKTIVPKSDQLNADSLPCGKTLTIKITKVTVTLSEQPVTIYYEGDNGRPYKPGKSMRRVLIELWGSDGDKYVGRSLTLYTDGKVTFGGMAVGGLRISHMSNIPEAITLALTTSKGHRKPYQVKPLAASSPSSTVTQPAAAPDPAPAPTIDPDKKYVIKTSTDTFAYATGKEWREKFKVIVDGYTSIKQCQGLMRANEAYFQVVASLNPDAFGDVISYVSKKEGEIRENAAS